MFVRIKGFWPFGLEISEKKQDHIFVGIKGFWSLRVDFFLEEAGPKTKFWHSAPGRKVFGLFSVFYISFAPGGAVFSWLFDAFDTENRKSTAFRFVRRGRPSQFVF